MDILESLNRKNRKNKWEDICIISSGNLKKLIEKNSRRNITFVTFS